MKRLLPVILLFLSMHSFSHAQVAVKVYQFRPLGEMGAVMNKTITGELLYMRDFEDHWRTRIGLTFAKLKSRLDTFPVQAVMYSGSTGTTVLPGYQTFHKFNISYLSAGFDYSLGDLEPVFVYPGLDLLVGGINMEYDLFYPTYKSESYSGGNVLAGLRFRAGGEYIITDNISTFLELSRSFYLVQEQGIFANDDIGLGIKYNF